MVTKVLFVNSVTCEARKINRRKGYLLVSAVERLTVTPVIFFTGLNYEIFWWLALFIVMAARLHPSAADDSRHVS